MLPVELGEPSLQNVHFIEEENIEILKEALELAKETIKEVHLRIELYQTTKRTYNSWVRPRNFLIGDLTLRKCGKSLKDLGEGMLAAN